MTFTMLLIVLVVGVGLYFGPIDERIKKVIAVAVIMMAILWGLNFFGIVTSPNIYVH